MRAKELMIGDWVLCDMNAQSDYEFDNVDYQPYQIANGEDIDYAIENNKIGDADVYQPIPLTSELLEANGFKKFNFHDIEGQHQWSWWHDTLTSMSLWCRELNDDPKDGWMIRIESPLATCCHKVEHVHELQQTLRVCKIEKEIEL
jgi:hypothetical protein